MLLVVLTTHASEEMILYQFLKERKRPGTPGWAMYDAKDLGQTAKDRYPLVAASQMNCICD